MPKGVYDRTPALEQAEDAPEIAATMVQAELSTMRDQMARELADIQALKAKLELQTAVRSEVSEALRLQQEEQKRIAFGKITPSAAPPMPPKPDEKLITVKLERNYHPAGYFEVAGWNKEAVTRKNAAGIVIEVEPAEFIADERKPPKIAGTGFADKIWAGTVLRVPETEARRLRKAGIGSIELD